MLNLDLSLIRDFCTIHKALDMWLSDLDVNFHFQQMTDTDMWTPGLTFCGREYSHNRALLSLISPLFFKLTPVKSGYLSQYTFSDCVSCYRLPVLGGEGIMRSHLMTISITMLFLHIPMQWISSSWTLTKIELNMCLGSLVFLKSPFLSCFIPTAK